MSFNIFFSLFYYLKLPLFKMDFLYISLNFFLNLLLIITIHFTVSSYKSVEKNNLYSLGYRFSCLNFFINHFNFLFEKFNFFFLFKFYKKKIVLLKMIFFILFLNIVLACFFAPSKAWINALYKVVKFFSKTVFLCNMGVNLCIYGGKFVH